MPNKKKNQPIVNIADMTAEDRYDMTILIDYGSTELFNDEQYVDIYNSIYNTKYTKGDWKKEGSEINNANVKSHFFMYLMTEKGLDPDEITDMSLDDVKKYVEDFHKDVKAYPIYGEEAEKLDKETLQNNIMWYSKLYGGAYKKICNDKFNANAPFSTEAEIAVESQSNYATFFQVLDTIAHSDNRIKIDEVPEKEGFTKKESSKLFSDKLNEEAGEKKTSIGNNIFHKASRASHVFTAMDNAIDPGLSIQQRAAYKLALEAEFEGEISGKKINFTDSKLKASDFNYRFNKITEALDDEKKGEVFKAFTEEECKKILTTPLKDLEKNDTLLYDKAITTLSDRLPIMEFNIKKLKYAAQNRRKENEELIKKAEEDRKSIYDAFEDIAKNGHPRLAQIKYLPEKNGKIDHTAPYVKDEMSNAEYYFDQIFAPAMEKQKKILAEKNNEYHVDTEFVSNFMVSDPEGNGRIPVNEACEKYKNAKDNDGFFKDMDEYRLSKVLVMLDIKNRRPVYYDPIIYAVDGEQKGKPIRASRDNLEPIQTHVHDALELDSKSVQLEREHDKEKNAQNVENYQRRKKTKAEYEAIINELKKKEELYEREYQRDLEKAKLDAEKKQKELKENLKKGKKKEEKKNDEEKIIKEVNEKEVKISEVEVPDDNEDDIFKAAEEAYQEQLRINAELKRKEEEFKKGSKFCIQALTEKDKQLYDIIDEDLEELQKYIDAENQKSDKQKETEKKKNSKVKMPEGAEDTKGISGDALSKLRDGRLKLDKRHFFSWLGNGASHELSRVKHQTDRLLDFCIKCEKSGKFEAKYFLLRDELVEKLQKEAEIYDKAKRGKKHLNDKNWKPFWGRDQVRFNANKDILDFTKEYNSKFALKDKKLKDSKDISDKVIDVLDEKQWLERIADIDPKRKPADPEEQKRIIKDIEDCAVGLLNASFSKKFIKKEEINVEAAEMFFDVNSDKIAGSKAFSQIKSVMKGKDDWEKAMNLKKLVEKNKGKKIVEEYSKVVTANKKANKEKTQTKKVTVPQKGK